MCLITDMYAMRLPTEHEPYQHGFVLNVFLGVEPALRAPPPHVRPHDGAEHCHHVKGCKVSKSRKHILLPLSDNRGSLSPTYIVVHSDDSPTTHFHAQRGAKTDHHEELPRMPSSLRAKRMEKTRRLLNTTNLDALKSWKR